MKTVLFQGDSITDGQRIRDEEFDLGKGYALGAAARLGCECPEEYRFYNRGISGNGIVDLYSRIKKDAINLNPDFMSVLIGVNDVLHDFYDSTGVDCEKYEMIYSMFIEEFKESCPSAKIMIMEPFILEEVFASNKMGADPKAIRHQVKLRAEAAKGIADKYNLTFMPLQEDLDRLAAKTKEQKYWLSDGVHPTEYFHNYIAEKWVKAFKSVQE